MVLIIRNQVRLEVHLPRVPPSAIAKKSQLYYRISLLLLYAALKRNKTKRGHFRTHMPFATAVEPVMYKTIFYKNYYLAVGCHEHQLLTFNKHNMYPDMSFFYT